MKLKIMKCGHVGYAESTDGKPYCLICNCDELADKNEINDLSKRKAQCWCCGKIEDSSYGLPFFEARLNMKYDQYYCGCGGWD